MYAEFVVVVLVLLLIAMQLFDDVLLFVPMIATLLSFVATIVTIDLM
jgi:hypothetical protein